MDETKEIYTRLNTLEREVTSIGTQLTTISDAVQQLVHRQNQPFNWIGLGSLLIAVTVAFGTYLHTRLEPISQALVQNRDDHLVIEERVNDRSDTHTFYLQRQIDDVITQLRSEP